jgi:hypothetical protein
MHHGCRDFNPKTDPARMQGASQFLARLEPRNFGKPERLASSSPTSVEDLRRPGDLSPPENRDNAPLPDPFRWRKKMRSPLISVSVRFLRDLFSAREGHEIFEQPQSHRLAFFRMELRGENVIAPHR